MTLKQAVTRWGEEHAGYGLRSIGYAASEGFEEYEAIELFDGYVQEQNAPPANLEADWSC